MIHDVISIQDCRVDDTYPALLPFLDKECTRVIGVRVIRVIPDVIFLVDGLIAEFTKDYIQPGFCCRCLMYGVNR